MFGCGFKLPTAGAVTATPGAGAHATIDARDSSTKVFIEALGSLGLLECFSCEIDAAYIVGFGSETLIYLFFETV